jgi:hypothetical protein
VHYAKSRSFKYFLMIQKKKAKDRAGGNPPHQSKTICTIFVVVLYSDPCRMITTSDHYRAGGVVRHVACPIVDIMDSQLLRYVSYSHPL